MHRFNFPRLAAVLVTAIFVFVAGDQGPGTAGPRGPSDTAPTFAVTVADQTYTEGEAVSPLTLPVASGGNGTLSYSLAPTVPGLTFDRGHTHAERHADLCRQLRHDVPGGRWRQQHRRQ